MGTIHDLDTMVQKAKSKGLRKKVAIAWAADSTTRHAVGSALAEGLVEAIFVGCREEVENDSLVMKFADHITIVDASDSDEACRTAVSLIRNGAAEILMKGMVNTDNLLHAVLDKKDGILPPGAVLTHISVTHVPEYKKLLVFSDAAVIPYPNLAQRHEQVRMVAHILRQMGIKTPKIALTHCSEKVDERHFPFTKDYVEIMEMANAGEFGSCIVDGPMDVKTACSLKAMQKKQIDSPIKGAADGLIFPDIEAANTFYKTLTLFCNAQVAGIIVGTSAPIVLPSRGDSVRSKFYSLVFATLK